MYRNLFLFGVAVAFLASLPMTASAGTIAVGDADFEQSIIGAGVTGVPNNGSPWVAVGNANIFNSTPYYDIVVAGSRANVANIETQYGSTGDWMWETLSEIVQPNTKYTLQVDVAKRISTTWMSGYAVQLNDGATTLQTFTNPVVPGNDGAWVTAEVSYTTGATVAGGPLGVVFHGVTNGDVAGKTTTFVDNVRLSSEAIPEPSTIALVATGLISLLAYAWRRRK